VIEISTCPTLAAGAARIPQLVLFFIHTALRNAAKEKALRV
jgi:hypothetical protein